MFFGEVSLTTEIVKGAACIFAGVLLKSAKTLRHANADLCIVFMRTIIEAIQGTA